MILPLRHHEDRWCLPQIRESVGFEVGICDFKDLMDFEPNNQ